MSNLVLVLTMGTLLLLVIGTARKELHRQEREIDEQMQAMRIRQEITQIINKRPHHLVRDNNQACEDMQREERHD